MKSTSFAFAISFALTVGQTTAQIMGNYQYGYIGNTSYNTKSDNSSRDRGTASKATIINDNEIIIEVNGLINAKANDFVATFNIVQVGETADSTNQMMNRKINRFEQELKKIGISSSDMNVDMLSFVPRYDMEVEKKAFSKTYNEVPAGFEMQKNVTVRFKESSKLDEIVFVASKLEIYDLVKVDYFLSNIQVPLDSIRNRCLKEVKTKMKSYESIGFKLDTMPKVMADDFNAVYPPTRYYSYTAFTRPSLHAAKKKETVNEIPKVETQYYSGIDYDEYDVVINPVVIEPMVQVSYSVTVKYFIQQKNINDKVIIVTANGDTKSLVLN